MRKEKDSLGVVDVPKNAYFGAFTVRARHNFKISDLEAPRSFKDALVLVKMAAAITNGKLKTITKKQEKAIVEACGEFIEGKFDDEFYIDVFQAGAGTSYNMNANEVLANRANEILGGTKGKYEHVHPNNHVNNAQSTNDVIPTASRIATLFVLPPLLQEIAALEDELAKLAKKHAKDVKVGRTHFQDAVPITFGQEFDGYREAFKKAREQIVQQSAQLQEVGIGGTAVGTGINTHPDYKKTMVQNLSEITGISFHSGKSLTEMANNMNAFMNVSAAIRALATTILNFCNDLKLLSMGPKAGIAELTLPSVQPGSSIMPGKINPSVPECLEMIAFQMLGNDHTIAAAAQRSQFDLNVFCPIIMFNLIQSIEIATNGLRTLREFAIEDLEVNTAHAKSLLDNSLATATALAPHIGYLETSDVVKTALRESRSIKEEVQRRKLLDPKQLETILSPEATTKPKKG